MHPLKTQHVWIAVLEVNDFSSHSDSLQVNLRDRLRTMVRNALEDAHLDPDRIAAKDVGHGLVLIFRSDVQPLHIAGGFLDRLNENLDEARPIYNTAAALRIRVALHHGMAIDDEGTWTGDAVRAARDLVNAPALYTVLNAAPQSQMAVIASEEFYSVVVRPGHRSLNPQSYVPVILGDDRTRRIRAWVKAPGYETPPGLPARAQKLAITGSPSVTKVKRRRIGKLPSYVATGVLLVFLGRVCPAPYDLPSLLQYWKVARPRISVDLNVDSRVDSRVESQPNASPAFKLNVPVGREVDLDTAERTPYFSSGLPGDGHDLGFLGGSLWSGVGAGITSVADDAVPKLDTCKNATGYAVGKWTDVETQGLPESKVRKGQAFCVITNENRYFLIRVKKVVPDTKKKNAEIMLRGFGLD